MKCKSLWIKASAKCINVNVKIFQAPAPLRQGAKKKKRRGAIVDVCVFSAVLAVKPMLLIKIRN